VRLVVLDIQLLQGNHRLGAILDVELAEGGSDMGPEGDKGSVILDIQLLQGNHRLCDS
jgi:hypothetical protein